VHTVEETRYGYKVTLRDSFDPESMMSLLNTVRSTVRRREDFGVVIDLRQAPAFPAEAQEVLRSCFDTFRGAGMGRQAVVLNSAIAGLQARRLSREAGIGECSRYLDVSANPEWERQALDWVILGAEPALELQS
jgi:hypothetical protein